MSIDVNKAIKMSFNDPNWAQKFLIGGLFYLVVQIINSAVGVSDYLVTKSETYSSLPFMAAFSAITFKLSLAALLMLISTIPIGYVLQNVHNQIKGTSDLLPEWNNNFYSYFINGVKYLLIKFIYSIILAVLVIIPTIIGVISFNLTSDNTAVSYAVAALFSIIVIAIILAYSVMIPLIFISFAENFNIAEAFRVKKFYRIILTNLGDYVICDLLVLAGVIILMFLYFVLVCTCIGILFIPFLYLPFFVIIMNLFTQVYLNAKIQNKLNS